MRMGSDGQREDASRSHRHEGVGEKPAMYESFYGLKEKPFSLLPDPAYLYLSKQHEMAITLLEYSLENQAGFCVISGKAGTGKTTLLRRLLHQIGNDVSIGLISNTHHSFGELLRWILHAFSLEDTGKTRAQLHQIFVDHLIGQYAKNRRTLLIIDEAQNMSSAALEELRMLSNINSEKDLLLQVILVGQPPLREILRQPELKQFAQRIAVDYHLNSLSREETHGYIHHRITVAGGEHELFSEDACDAVFERCSGIPRLINLLCDFALVYAYASQAAVVTEELVEQVVREREKYGALPVFAAAKESRVKQNLPAREARPLIAAKLPADTVAHATRQTVAARAMTAAGGTTPAEGYGKTVNTLPPETRHESHVEITVRASAIDANLSTTSGTSLVKNAGAVTQTQKMIVTPLNGKESYKIFGGIETERLSPQTLASEQLPVQKPDRLPDELTPAVKDTQTKAIAPPLDNSGDTDRAKLPDAGITNSTSVSRGFAARKGDRRAAPMAKRYIPVAFVGGVLLSAALIWFFVNQQSGHIQAASGKASKPSVVAVTPVADMTPAKAVPADDRIPDTQPLERISPIHREDTGKAVAKKDPDQEARLKSIERERDTALALAKAAEREALRNAVVLAQERALAAEHEMALARERERANPSALAAEKAKQEARAVEAAAVVVQERKPEPVSPSQARIATDTAAPKSAGVGITSQNTGTETGNDEKASEPAPFTANPCKGPSARFLSTCK